MNNMIGRTVRDDETGELGEVAYYNPVTLRLDVEWEFNASKSKRTYVTSKKLHLKLFHLWDSGFSFI